MHRPLFVLLLAAACTARPTPSDRPGPTAGADVPPVAVWADSAARLIERGVHAQNRAHIADARSLVERALTRFPGDPLLLHYQGYALFREAGLAWSVDESEVPPLLRESERLLARSFERLPIAESAALLARIQGYLSALYPRLAADLGARARGFRADADRLGPDNPRVWLLRGQASLYTPELHGGGLRNAEQQLSRAVSLFASDGARPGFPAWGVAEAYAWLGQAYARSGRIAAARQAYEEALAIAPEYIWVRESLLPALASLTPEPLPAIPVVPLNTNFWSYWTHYWTTWLPDHPVYEMIELTAYESPSDPDDILLRVFLTEREGRKQQYFYLNDRNEVARTRANAFYRDIVYRRTGPENGPQSLRVEFTDKDSIPIEWTITFPPEARLRDYGSDLTPSIHSVGAVLLLALRTRTVDTHNDRVLFAGVDYASDRAADDSTPGTRSWHNPGYYSAILLFGRLTFTHHDGILSNSWGRRFAPLPGDPFTFRTGDLGPDNFAQFVLDSAGGMLSYSHFSRGHSLDFTFDPPLPPLATAETGTRFAFSVSFDNARPLMTGVAHIQRVKPDVVVLRWVPAEPQWALGRDFWSVIRFEESGYELTLTDDRRVALPEPQ